MSKKGRKRPMKKSEIAGGAVYSVIKIVVIILALMMIYRVGSMAFDYGERIFGEPAMEDEPGTDVVINISEGDSVGTVAEKLENAGLIRDVALFKVQEKLFAKYDILPGTYTLNTSQTVEDMVQIITAPAKSEEEDD